MSRPAWMIALLVVTAFLISGDWTSRPGRAPLASLLAAEEDDAAEPAEGETIVVGQPVPVPIQPFVGFGQHVQFMQGGIVQQFDDGSAALLNAYHQMGQTIEQDKQENRPTSASKLKLHKALRDYLAEETLNRISNELKGMDDQFPGAPAARKAKLALKALTFDATGDATSEQTEGTE